MAGTRLNFTDRQKAEVFVRDRATCCFSGANLWLLDSPLRPGYETDWVDHIFPASRGGTNAISNAVCAGHTFNSKKRANVSDTFYLFREGRPTPGYFEVFGVLPNESASRLRRLSGLAVEDWYLNRAITWVLSAVWDRCAREAGECDYKRDSAFWMRAAFRKLSDFQRLSQGATLEDRGVISNPDEIQRGWLSTRSANDPSSFSAAVEPLFHRYRSNYSAWNGYFWIPETEEQRLAAFHEVMGREGICDSVRSSIQQDWELRLSVE